MPKPTQGKPTPVAQQSGRKSRKSQPKRNIRHAAIIESDDDSGGPSAQDQATPSWRERSVSSVDETEASARDTNDMESSFDLSKVKHEVEDSEEHVRAKQNDKGQYKYSLIC